MNKGLKPLKRCAKCNAVKVRSEFYLRAVAKGALGYIMAMCKKCHIEYSRVADWAGKYPARKIALQLKYQKQDPAKYCALVMRRDAAKKKRIPSWANLEKIEDIYRQARVLTLETGIKYHVDHVIPLQGKLVSGLHVEGNLEAIPAKDNHRKYNFFNPMETSL